MPRTIFYCKRYYWPQEMFWCDNIVPKYFCFDKPLTYNAFKLAGLYYCAFLITSDYYIASQNPAFWLVDLRSVKTRVRIFPNLDRYPAHVVVLKGENFKIDCFVDRLLIKFYWKMKIFTTSYKEVTEKMPFSISHIIISLLATFVQSVLWNAGLCF